MEAGAGLKDFPLLILYEKNSFGGWGGFEAFSFTNTLRKAHLVTGADLTHFTFINPLRKLHLEAGPGLDHSPL